MASQTEDLIDANSLFDDGYAYFSSVSKSWLSHAKKYSHHVKDRFNLSSECHIVEIASNDGYLLKNFLEMNIPCLGIEPTASTASVAESLGIPVLKSFFSENLAQELVKARKSADLIVGNNVYAHVPDINDFTRGIATLLKPSGVVTLEFPHLMRLIEFCQFDTVYHEHFSYLSALTVSKIFLKAGLEYLTLKNYRRTVASLRVYGCHSKAPHPITSKAQSVLSEEYKRGLDNIIFMINLSILML